MYSDKIAYDNIGSYFNIGDKVIDKRDNITKYIVDIECGVTVILSDEIHSKKPTNTIYIKHV